MDISFHMPDEPLMQQAWVDCLRWACSEEAILEAFRDETGLVVKMPRNGLERMIDEATGVNEQVAQRFVEWFNANIWGEVEAAKEVEQ